MTFVWNEERVHVCIIRAANLVNFGKSLQQGDTGKLGESLKK